MKISSFSFMDHGTTQNITWKNCWRGEGLTLLGALIRDGRVFQNPTELMKEESPANHALEFRDKMLHGGNYATRPFTLIPEPAD